MNARRPKQVISPLAPIVVEGAADRFCGRSQDRCPYASGAHRSAWRYGWQEADRVLMQRAEEELRRWQGTA